MEETRTVLRTPCPECDLSPRASGACVLLSGPGGFPLHLIGRCPQCSVTLGAWQSGPVAARPLSVAYPQNAELRSYRVYDVDEPRVVVAEGEAVWELDRDDDPAEQEAGADRAADTPTSE